MKAGEKLEDASGASAVVVKPPEDGDVTMRAGGAVMLGKRYRCETCTAEVLVTKPGDVELVCHDTVMALAQAKALPSSD